MTLILGHGALALLLIGWLPLALVLLPLPRRARGIATRQVIHRAMRGYRRWLGLIGALRFDTAALDTLRSAPPGVIVANHPSLLDALVVLSHAPNVVCVMRAGLLRNPFFALPARLAGYLPNDNPVDMMLGGRHAIRDGCHVLLFPEGSRTPPDSDEPVAAFHPAPFMLARRSRAPLHAFVFRYARPFLAKGHTFWGAPRLPVSLQVAPLDRPGDPSVETDPHRAARAWHHVYCQQLAST